MREHARRRRLLAALEEICRVRFEARSDGDWANLDAVVQVGRPAVESPSGMPCLQALGDEREAGSSRVVALAGGDSLERPLRGARLTDSWLGSESVALAPGDRCLASAEGRTLWAASGARPERQVVAVAPEELAEGEALRERLKPGRCLALLALVHFLRGLPPDRTRPPLRAAFVLDDPNLHWPSYGHLDYEALSSHALDHGYHLAVAMVPLDGWLAHPRAVRIFRVGVRQLSVCIHGNDHAGPELGRIASERDGVRLASHALRRAAAFARRTGVTVDKVMIPPHEQLSAQAARALLACGYEGVCVSRPYPWIAAPRQRYQFAAPAERTVLAGWSSPELIVGGLPLFLRAGFNAPREDLVLRAFLGQPLILYGHHDVLKDGLDVVADAASAVNAMGEVQWGSLGAIARAFSRDRVDGDAARLAVAHTLTDRAPRRRLMPLLRRLASEGRDRAQALTVIDR